MRDEENPALVSTTSYIDFFYVYSALCLAYFGRMDGDKHFKCALTQVAPGLKSSWPLHPWVRVFIKPLILPLQSSFWNQQKRIITVRECARAQGFPDSYVFKSINTDPSKIVQDVSLNFQNVT